MARRRSEWARIERSKEARLWTTQVVLPVLAIGTYYFSKNPEQVNYACAKVEAFMDGVKNKLHLNKKNED